MREPWQWQEDDLEALLREQRLEDLQLEYKRSDALSKTEQKKKTEITKDVSAMANSAGGTIIYGIDEQRPHGPIKLDSGIDGKDISTEWLEQVIASGIHRRIEAISIQPVKMSSAGKLVYVVWIPQSNRAPHMAADYRYYRRLGTTTAVMEEYDVRDVARRLEAPDLDLEIKTRLGPSDEVWFYLRLSNRSPEPVLYATCRLYVENAMSGLELIPNANWSKHENTELLFNNQRLTFQTVHQPWSIPFRHPILEGEHCDLGPVALKLGVDMARTLETLWCSIGWELRAPKAESKLLGLKLAVKSSGTYIQEQTYSL